MIQQGVVCTGTMTLQMSESTFRPKYAGWCIQIFVGSLYCTGTGSVRSKIPFQLYLLEWLILLNSSLGIWWGGSVGARKLEMVFLSITAGHNRYSMDRVELWSVFVRVQYRRSSFAASCGRCSMPEENNDGTVGWRDIKDDTVYCTSRTHPDGLTTSS